MRTLAIVLGGLGAGGVAAVLAFASPGPQAQQSSAPADSITALLYSQSRGDLFQLYALSLATGMNYRMTSIPMDIPVPADATSFDPKVMGWLYDQGHQRGKSGKLWRTTPPGTEPGEEVPIRGGTRLQSGRSGRSPDQSVEH